MVGVSLVTDINRNGKKSILGDIQNHSFLLLLKKEVGRVAVSRRAVAVDPAVSTTVVCENLGSPEDAFLHEVCYLFLEFGPSYKLSLLDLSIFSTDSFGFQGSLRKAV